MTTVFKDKILRSDLANWDGLTSTRSRKDSTGGTITGLKVGTEVDVLQVYGGGTEYTGATIQKCIDALGSTSVTLVFQPGTWVISSNVTVGSNFTCRVPNGVVFSPASGITLTFSGPVIRDGQTWTGGSGTVTENGTRYLSGKLDLTGAVLQGASPLVFEGGTDNAFETTFTFTNPTADRTVTFPDANVDFTNVVVASGAYTFTGSNTFSGTSTFSGLVTLSGKSIIHAEGADVASAADCDIWAGGDGNTVHITGTTTIADWGTAPQAGAWMDVIFDGALQLTYNATTNKLNTNAQNYTTAAGDRARVYAETTTSFVVTVFPLSGKPIGGSGTLGTPITTTSGTAHDFTIPAWATHVIIDFTNISTNGTSEFIIQIGDSGGIETSGYSGVIVRVDSASGVQFSSGFTMTNGTAAGSSWIGQVELVLHNSSTFTWVCRGMAASSLAAQMSTFCGFKTLSAALTTVRLTTASADTFDAGAVNVRYS